MKKQYADIDYAVKIKADNLKLLKIENKKQQEYYDQQIRDLKALSSNQHPGMVQNSAPVQQSAEEIDKLKQELIKKQ